ncbi:MAG: hypothetical protein QMC33_12875 [Octadecabacter sp.]|jgi:hypothetical protein
MRTTFKMLSRALFGIFRDHKLTAAMDEKQFFDPSHANRVHVFHGTFVSELAATSYCFDAPSRNEPEPLTRDLPDAMIDTTEVEIIFGTARIGSAVPMLTQYTEDLFNEIGSDNTLVLIAEAAFGGLPYSLNDTPVLRYAGAFDVT